MRSAESRRPVSRDNALAVAEENLEIVRKAWAVWLQGDLDALFSDYFAPDALYDLTHFREWPDAQYRGVDGVRRGLTEWLEVWDAWEAGVDDVLAAPDGRVLVLTWQRGQGRQSGLPMDMRWAQVITLRDGRITRVDASAFERRPSRQRGCDTSPCVLARGRRAPAR